MRMVINYNMAWAVGVGDTFAHNSERQSELPNAHWQRSLGFTQPESAAIRLRVKNPVAMYHSNSNAFR